MPLIVWHKCIQRRYGIGESAYPSSSTDVQGDDLRYRNIGIGIIIIEALDQFNGFMELIFEHFSNYPSLSFSTFKCHRPLFDSRKYRLLTV